ncbi:N-acetyl-alpha-D-glucosaminyl L-malate synthase BshA [Candidatus Zixiibacteriota bacterium]
MNIGITCYPVPGGSGVLATELGAQLARRGHEVHFISHALPYRLDEFAPNVFYHEVEVSTYPLFEYPPYTLSLASRMSEVSRQAKLDVLHVHYAIPFAIAGHIAQEMLGEAAPKLVTTLHGTDITLVGMDKSFFEITKYSIKISDRVTAVSRYLAAKTKAEFGVERDIDVVYNFVDTSRFTPQGDHSCKSKYAPGGEKVIMHLSNFRPVKNITGVIHIFHRLTQKQPAVLLLVGDGPESGAALALAGRLGIGDKVHFLGNQQRVENLFACADAFLLPSYYESFGLAALEAMACGVPVVAANVGGVSEVITDGETGYLIDPDDYDAGAEKLDLMLSDNELAAKLKEAALKTVRDNFTAEKIVPQYEKIYGA